MGWARLTRPRGAADGSISWIRAWEKLLVHEMSEQEVCASTGASLTNLKRWRNRVLNA